MICSQRAGCSVTSLRLLRRKSNGRERSRSAWEEPRSGSSPRNLRIRARSHEGRGHDSCWPDHGHHEWQRYFDDLGQDDEVVRSSAFSG